MLDTSKFKGDPLELKWNRKGLHALEQVLPLVKKRDAVVQAGGCLGVFAKRLASEFKAVYVFEPSQQFVNMTANAPEPNIIRFQAALGNAPGMVEPVNSLEGYDGKVILHSGMTMVKPGGIVPKLCLDDLELPHCDLLYLDVEGYELYALDGALETIKRCWPVIVVEINRAIEILSKGEFTGDSVRNYIKRLGYEFKQRTNSDEVFLPCMT